MGLVLCKYRREEVVIHCACLTEKNFECVDVDKASVAVKNFSRLAPNFDNYQESENYNEISEITIKFAGESISRVTLQFAFEKTMVLITGSPDIINSDAINLLSLKIADMS